MQLDAMNKRLTNLELVGGQLKSSNSLTSIKSGFHSHSHISERIVEETANVWID